MSHSYPPSFIEENAMQMERILWLQYERPPHPDAVVYPAGEEDLKLVLAVMDLPYRERCHLSGLLRNWLSEAESQNPFERPGVAVRFGAGLYHPVPWRFAKWLSCILPLPDAAAERTRKRIQNWLENEKPAEFVSLNSV